MDANPDLVRAMWWVALADNSVQYLQVHMWPLLNPVNQLRGAQNANFEALEQVFNQWVEHLSIFYLQSMLQISIASVVTVDFHVGLSL